MIRRAGAAKSASHFLSLLAFVALPSSALAQDDDPDIARFKAISEANTMVMVPMSDGVRLATDVYLPKGDGPFPVVFVKTPYNFNKLQGTGLDWAIEAVERGYAYVVQNERGRYYSEGEWEILGRPRTDGYDSLTWLAEQEWSTGKVSTMGCSSTAEWQLALAAQNHPAHAAMVPMASGAGIGRVGEYYEQGNWYKGGVHQTLFSIWLYGVQQDIRPRAPLNNGIWSLRDLKRTGARRTSQVMALVLGKKCNAATVRFRARPSGPSGGFALGVDSFRQADACLQTVALIANPPEGQRPYAINQRCPKPV